MEPHGIRVTVTCEPRDHADGFDRLRAWTLEHPEGSVYLGDFDDEAKALGLDLDKPLRAYGATTYGVSPVVDTVRTVLDWAAERMRFADDTHDPAEAAKALELARLGYRDAERGEMSLELIAHEDDLGLDPFQPEEAPGFDYDAECLKHGNVELVDAIDRETLIHAPHRRPSSARPRLRVVRTKRRGARRRERRSRRNKSPSRSPGGDEPHHEVAHLGAAA